MGDDSNSGNNSNKSGASSSVSDNDAFGETKFVWNGDVVLSKKRNSEETLYVNPTVST
ncbi:MAG: hypothetical protein WBA20_18230 [Ketobacter sp.]